jgi:hypothetical protein
MSLAEAGRTEPAVHLVDDLDVGVYPDTGSLDRT